MAWRRSPRRFVSRCSSRTWRGSSRWLVARSSRRAFRGSFRWLVSWHCSGALHGRFGRLKSQCMRWVLFWPLTLSLCRGLSSTRTRIILDQISSWHLRILSSRWRSHYGTTKAFSGCRRWCECWSIRSLWHHGAHRRSCRPQSRMYCWHVCLCSQCRGHRQMKSRRPRYRWSWCHREEPFQCRPGSWLFRRRYWRPSRGIR